MAIDKTHLKTIQISGGAASIRVVARAMKTLILDHIICNNGHIFIRFEHNSNNNEKLAVS